jgi:heme exporter protein D
VILVNLGPHATFIVAAYAAAALILALVIGWIVLDYRMLRQRLADFEARGVTRRSDAGKAA